MLPDARPATLWHDVAFTDCMTNRWMPRSAVCWRFFCICRPFVTKTVRDVRVCRVRSDDRDQDILCRIDAAEGESAMHWRRQPDPTSEEIRVECAKIRAENAACRLDRRTDDDTSRSNAAKTDCVRVTMNQNRIPCRNGIVAFNQCDCVVNGR